VVCSVTKEILKQKASHTYTYQVVGGVHVSLQSAESMKQRTAVGNTGNSTTRTENGQIFRMDTNMNTNSIVRGVENVRFTPNRHFGLAVCGASNVVHRGAYQLVPVLPHPWGPRHHK